MIIVASNGSGDLASIFDGDVFMKVLSVFITAAILKLGQGTPERNLLLTMLHYLFLVSWVFGQN